MEPKQSAGDSPAERGLSAEQNELLEQLVETSAIDRDTLDQMAAETNRNLDELFAKLRKPK